LNGTWKIGDESITSVTGSGIELSYLAKDIYLDIGGTGSITATLDGVTKRY